MIGNLSEVWLTLEIAKSDVSPLSLDDLPGLLEQNICLLGQTSDTTEGTTFFRVCALLRRQKAC